jgi:hypothetical protein
MNETLRYAGRFCWVRRAYSNLRGATENTEKDKSEKALTTADTTKNKEPVIPANAGIQKRTFRREAPHERPPS